MRKCFALFLLSYSLLCLYPSSLEVDTDSDDVRLSFEHFSFAYPDGVPGISFGPFSCGAVKADGLGNAFVRPWDYGTHEGLVSFSSAGRKKGKLVGGGYTFGNKHELLFLVYPRLSFGFASRCWRFSFASVYFCNGPEHNVLFTQHTLRGTYPFFRSVIAYEGEFLYARVILDLSPVLRPQAQLLFALSVSSYRLMAFQGHLISTLDQNTERVRGVKVEWKHECFSAVLSSYYGRDPVKADTYRRKELSGKGHFEVGDFSIETKMSTLFSEEGRLTNRYHYTIKGFELVTRFDSKHGWGFGISSKGFSLILHGDGHFSLAFRVEGSKGGFAFSLGEGEDYELSFSYSW